MVKNLRKLRNEKNLSQQKLAEIVGVSQQSINKYENHQIEPDILTLIKLADYFETSVDYLVGHTDIRCVIDSYTPFDLNPRELKLMENFRRLTPKQREAVGLVIENYLD